MGRTKPGASWIRPVELNCRSEKVPLSRGIVKEKLRVKQILLVDPHTRPRNPKAEDNDENEHDDDSRSAAAHLVALS